MTGATGGQAFYINVDHGHQFYFGVVRAILYNHRSCHTDKFYSTLL